MELAHGKSPELKGMANKIVSEQKKRLVSLNAGLQGRSDLGLACIRQS